MSDVLSIAELEADNNALRAELTALKARPAETPTGLAPLEPLRAIARELEELASEGGPVAFAIMGATIREALDAQRQASASVRREAGEKIEQDVYDVLDLSCA